MLYEIECPICGSEFAVGEIAGKFETHQCCNCDAEVDLTQDYVAYFASYCTDAAFDPYLGYKEHTRWWGAQDIADRIAMLKKYINDMRKFGKNDAYISALFKSVDSYESRLKRVISENS